MRCKRSSCICRTYVINKNNANCNNGICTYLDTQNLVSGTGYSYKISIIDTNNVSIVDGVQIVDIKVKGGYLPRKSIAKAGIPTIIRFNTSGTFDCSAFIRIPSLNVSRSLPQSGSTEINIGTPTTTDLQGSCGMGMYPFDVDFR